MISFIKLLVCGIIFHIYSCFLCKSLFWCNWIMRRLLIPEEHWRVGGQRRDEKVIQMKGRSTWKSTWVCKGEAQGTCPWGQLRIGLALSSERRSIHESGSRGLGEREELNLGNLILRPCKARMWENGTRSTGYSILPWSVSRRKWWAEVMGRNLSDGREEGPMKHASVQPTRFSSSLAEWDCDLCVGAGHRASAFYWEKAYLLTTLGAAGSQVNT